MNRYSKGFTLIELLVVVAIIGILALSVAPNILNSLEVRGLENSARDIITTLQKAKFEAVKTKIFHRARFALENEQWEIFLEREDTPGAWSLLPGYSRKQLPQKYNITINLPDSDVSVTFSPLGFVTNFDKDKNSIVLQSDKLLRGNQDDQRGVQVFAGGSFKYTKSASEE